MDGRIPSALVWRPNIFSEATKFAVEELILDEQQFKVPVSNKKKIYFI